MGGNLRFEVKASDGTVRVYELEPITVETAIEVQDTVFRAFAKAACKVLGASISSMEDVAGLMKMDLSNLVPALGEIFDAMPRRVFWDLAWKLLGGALIRSEDTRPILDRSCEVEFAGKNGRDAFNRYYAKNYFEVYVAVERAFGLNWPNFFTEIRVLVSGLFAGIKNRSKGPTESGMQHRPESSGSSG